MRAGYKMTKFGYIPTNWEDLRFGDIVTFSGGAQPPRRTFKFTPHDDYIRLIQTRDYKSDKYKTYIPKDLARKKCKKDDIMIGRYGPPIFQILRGLEGAYNVALLKAIPDETKLDKEYLFYYISQYAVWAFVENLSQRSGGQTGVDLVQLRKYPFPLPPLAEQRKIASILSTVDEKINSIQERILATVKLKKGLMQRLLNKGIGHSRFKKTKLGEIPESWEVVRLGTLLSKIIGGGTPSRENMLYWNGDISWATVKDLKNSILNETQEKISKDGLLNSSANLIKKWTLIISTRMALGKAVFFTKDVAINQDLKALYPTVNLEKEYLFHWFYANAQKILGLGSGSTVKGIRLEVLKAIDFILPPIEEQKQIASTLSEVDQKLDALKTKKAQYQDLKKGLMQQLLTGKIRVK